MLVEVANKKKSSLRKRENLVGWLYISPMLIGIALFTAIPLVMSVMTMFRDWTGVEGLLESNFVGLQNFKYLFDGEFDSQQYWQGMVNTLIFAIQLPVCLILGMFLALGMNRKMRGVQAFRVIYYLPGVISVVAVSIIWQKVFNANGIMDTMLGFNVGWLEKRALVAIVVNLLLVWKGVGYSTLMFLAGLQSVSTDQIEAAKIDGATGWKIFTKITMPALYPIIFYLLVTGLMGSLQMFNEPYILLGDKDPNGLTVVSFIYNRFGSKNLGLAAVGSWVLAILIFIVTAIQMWVDKKKREAE